MKLSHVFKGESLKPEWEFRTAGIVWRLVPTSVGLLVGEERFIDRKTVRFFCLRQESGRSLWEKVTFGEQWWIGIEAVHDDVMLLHTFASPDLPEHRGITAVDLQRGQVLWSSSDQAFVALRGTSLYVTRTGSTGVEILELDLRTGSFIRELKGRERIPPEPANDVPSGVMFPAALDLEKEHSAIVVQIRHSLPVQSTVGSVEAVGVEGMIVFSYHEHADNNSPEIPRFNNLLRILDRRTGAAIFQERLDNEVAAIVPDSFFVQGDILFYVKDRRTITAIRLVGEHG
jgi:hypothetical protein